MRIDDVSTSSIWVRQVQYLRDPICANNNTGNTCLSLQVDYTHTDTDTDTHTDTDTDTNTDTDTDTATKTLDTPHKQNTQI